MLLRMYCTAANETETVPPLSAVLFLICLDDCNTELINRSVNAPTKPCFLGKLHRSFQLAHNFVIA